MQRSDLITCSTNSHDVLFRCEGSLVSRVYDLRCPFSQLCMGGCSAAGHYFQSHGLEKNRRGADLGLGGSG